MRDIARADYGLQEEEHLTALRRIAAGDFLPLRPLLWVPREVLELKRWADIKDSDAALRPRHQQRLFAALVLLWSYGDPINEGRTELINDSLIATVDSVLIAFPEKRVDLLDFLTEFDDTQRQWVRGGYPIEEGFVHLARFLALAAQDPLPRDALALLIDKVENAIQTIRETSLSKKPRGRYGWAIKAYGGSSSRELWVRHLDRAADTLRRYEDCASLSTWLDHLAERKV